MEVLKKKIRKNALFVKSNDSKAERSLRTLNEANHALFKARKNLDATDAEYESAIACIENYMKSSSVCPTRLIGLHASMSQKFAQLEEAKLAKSENYERYQTARAAYVKDKSVLSASQTTLDNLNKNLQRAKDSQQDKHLSDLHNTRMGNQK